MARSARLTSAPPQSEPQHIRVAINLAPQRFCESRLDVSVAAHGFHRLFTRRLHPTTNLYRQRTQLVGLTGPSNSSPLDRRTVNESHPCKRQRQQSTRPRFLENVRARSPGGSRHDGRLKALRQFENPRFHLTARPARTIHRQTRHWPRRLLHAPNERQQSHRATAARRSANHVIAERPQEPTHHAAVPRMRNEHAHAPIGVDRQQRPLVFVKMRKYDGQSAIQPLPNRRRQLIFARPPRPMEQAEHDPDENELQKIQKTIFQRSHRNLTSTHERN